MTHKYTKGPWRAELDNVFAGETCQATYIADCNPMEDLIDTTANANATLIAAAPDLLEALGNLLNCVDGVHEQDWLDRCRAHAMSAIAKAEGR